MEYTGITIGPIFRTIDVARTTRELWASSYIFSYFIRELRQAIAADKEKYDVLMPAYLTLPKEDKIGAGLYPDRIIIRHLNGADDQGLTEICQTVLSAMAEEIADHLAGHHLSVPVDKMAEEIADHLAGHHLSVPVDEVEAQLTSFFQLYGQRLHIPEGENIVLSISPFLDAIEANPKIADLREGNNYLSIFLDLASIKPKGAPPSFLIEDAFGKHRKFDSLIEIAARGLQRLNEKKFNRIITRHFKAVNGKDFEQEEQLLKELTDAFVEQFKHYHKHVAIVYADGDGIRSSIEKIGNNDKGLKSFSRFLADFAQSAARDIYEYGGLPVYTGGDDLFFLAPVRVQAFDDSGKVVTDKTVLHLARELNGLFQRKYEEFRQENSSLRELPAPTLSFGVNIEHFKSPLYEGIIHSRERLFEQAKKKKFHPDKNTIAIRLATHSGQALTAELEMKDTDTFKFILCKIDKFIGAGIKFPNSFSRRLLLLDPVFEVAIGERGWNLSAYIKNLLEENDQKGLEEDFYSLVEMLYTKTNEVRKPKKVLEFIVRFIHFLNRENQPDE